MKQPNIMDEVMNLFTKHLETNNLRKTPERFTILEEIYSRDDHFEAETLFVDIKNKDFNISRATVYNTLELLNDCELITKHQFGKNHAQYEKAYGHRQHDHLICNTCGKITEFCDPRIQQIQNMVGDLLDFEITGHSLILYGDCNQENCENKK